MTEGKAELIAEPGSLTIDKLHTALMVIDMQNAFVSRGGLFDLLGQNIFNCQEIITNIKRLINIVHGNNCKVIYTIAVYSDDLHETGGNHSPNWFKSPSLLLFRENPELRDKLTVRNTWGANIINDLKPEKSDIVIEKQKYSAFFGTNLDIILKTFCIKYLAFTGVATNICVEATIRDAYYREYFPIMVSDACAHVGPSFLQKATEFNIKFNHGWITTTEQFIETFSIKKFEENRDSYMDSYY